MALNLVPNVAHEPACAAEVTGTFGSRKGDGGFLWSGGRPFPLPLAWQRPTPGPRGGLGNLDVPRTGVFQQLRFLTPELVGVTNGVPQDGLCPAEVVSCPGAVLGTHSSCRGLEPGQMRPGRCVLEHGLWGQPLPA